MGSPNINWTHELALKLEPMDTGHRVLLEKVNGLLQAVSSRDANAVAAALQAVTAEAKRHFAEEEAQMLAAGYPERARHVEHHHSLLRGLTELRSTLGTARSFDFSMGSFVYLERWFVPHVTRQDARFARFLATRKRAAAGADRAEAEDAAAVK